MVNNFNNLLTRRANDLFNIKDGNFFFNRVSDILTPVIPIEECSQIVKQAFVNNSVGATIYTTPTDKDFYITGATMSLIKDVTATSTQTSLRCTIGGEVLYLMQIVGITLTPQSSTISIALARPLKVDRGINITLNNATATGNVVAGCSVVGYLSDTTPIN